MLRMEVNISTERVVRALRKSPGPILRHAELGLERGGQEIAREQRRLAPKAMSQLVNSIGVSKPAPLSRLIGPSAEHGPYVDQGTGRHGPHGVASGRMPPPSALMDWIRVRGIQPDDPDMDDEELAFLIGRSIAARGTPKQPFVEPSFDAKIDRAVELIERGVERGVREALA